MTFTCINQDCLHVSMSMEAMIKHRQNQHRENLFVAAESAGISLVEAVLVKHGLVNNWNKVNLGEKTNE